MSCENTSSVDWSFVDGRFPEGLGVVVQNTVQQGLEPARSVIHDADGYWLVADGVNDPNTEGCAVVACMACLAKSDPTLTVLATMPPSSEAWREQRDCEWEIEKHSYPDE